MYCVIQEIELKKSNKYGGHRELKADSFTFTINGVTTTKYTHSYSEERFERPIKKAYKVSIHESKRLNGVVTKQQYVVTTVGYYDLVDYWIGDCLHEKKLVTIAEKLNTDLDHIWELINAKVDPLQEQIKLEFSKTEEYKTHMKHRKIIGRYNKAKAKFAKTYNCDSGEYDYCYNVFGELMNSKYFDKVINDYKAKQSYQNYKYYSGGHGNGNTDNKSSYFNLGCSNYTESEKAMLKQFYRTLSKSFHPDNIQGNGEEMQLINNLKKDWGI